MGYGLSAGQVCPYNQGEIAMNPWIQKGTAMLLAVGALSFCSTAQAEQKVQKITFIEDDAQKNMASKIYILKHTKAADLLPFVRNAVVRYCAESSVSAVNDSARKRQMLIVSTGINMIPYVDQIVAALDRDAKFGQYSNILGNGIVIGTYRPNFRATKSMLDVITIGGVASGVQDGRIRFDKNTNMFYFKDAPYKVDCIKQKLAWLDKAEPQTRLELTIYEVRDSDLKDTGIDYLAWKNGPGLNLFSVGYNALNVRAAEKVIETIAQHGMELASNATYGFGGIYTAPAFDMSFIRLLQQNGKATVSSTASVLVSNEPGKTFSVAFAPEYQNITKDASHISSVAIGGDASLTADISEAVITAGKNGTVNFSYTVTNNNVVERNNLGAELSEAETFSASATLPFNEERILAIWNRTSDVEQTIGVPVLCELPILKYIFGTTTNNTEVTRCIVTVRAVPVVYNETLAPGAVAEFDKLCSK